MIAPIQLPAAPATMSIAEARSLLGEEANGLSDAVLVDILRAMDVAAEIIIRKALEAA